MSLIKMNIHFVFVGFVSVLFGPVSADVLSFAQTEGKSITVRCNFGLSGGRRFFCKGECKKENILIETTGEKAHNGRYSLEYEGTYSSPVLYVTINQLTKLDTGWYKCGLSNFFTELHHDINLTVNAAPTTFTPATATTVTVKGYVFPVIVSVPVVVLLCVAVSLFLCKRKTKKNFDGVNLDGQNLKSPGEDPIYQSLTPASMDQDQTYSTLIHKHRA
ncbi:uncharacterized protein LOC121651095 [Melanotaenia boesemani]|uniref:uncharacterized protein LOC121651095 n=1 Tax=Melanotaenia boesemani TaxID=1250792 RepID=UPI001C03C168|nr:uncharacterized protein LOC121651095 [Melanotaenia boesemani]